METAKACVDVILGAIALTSGARTLEGYLKDMENRGQEPERIEEVKNALEEYAAKVGDIAIRKGAGGIAGDEAKEEEEKKIEKDMDIHMVR